MSDKKPKQEPKGDKPKNPTIITKKDAGGTIQKRKG